MSLRPRYSLLTLLVLTALVAGGAKWWYGPHHIVERTNPSAEVEYTFTRDWRGERTFHGSYVSRTTRPGLNSEIIHISYYRNGRDTNWHQLIIIDLAAKRFATQQPGANPFDDLEQLELQPQEYLEFQTSIQQELATLQKRGVKVETTVTPSKPEHWK